MKQEIAQEVINTPHLRVIMVLEQHVQSGYEGQVQALHRWHFENCRKQT